jgi:hypothetical protein
MGVKNQVDIGAALPYCESDRSTIPAHELRMIKEVIDRD